MSFTKNVFIFLALILLGACSSTMVYQDRIDVANGDSEIFIYRQNANPTAYSIDFKLNEITYASIAQKGSVNFKMPSGEYDYSIVWAPLTGGVNLKGALTLKKNTKHYYVLNGSFSQSHSRYTNKLALYEISENKWLQLTSVK